MYGRYHYRAAEGLDLVAGAVTEGAAFDAEDAVALDLFVDAVADGACAEAGRGDGGHLGMAGLGLLGDFL